MKRAIIIMTKVPLAGNVKTRLHGVLSPAGCAALAEAFLKDSVKKAKAVCENVFIAFDPSPEIQKLMGILPGETNFIEQTGEDLGARMCNAFQFVFALQTDAVVMIGTD